MSLAHPPFRRRNAAAVYAQHAGPNMTPMVDVVMVILIFFMASAAILGPEWFLRTSLPVKGQAAPGAEEPVRVRVVLSGAPADGVPGGAPTTASEAPTLASVEGEPSVQRVALAELERWLAARARAVGPDRLVVLVAPGPGASYDAVVRVHEACARLGILRVGITD